ncbi:unnamed protein product [Zymoseptoria tritici ST99CH_3D1]|nr:unnamed protein product [Zymoseptoria tritici ST99CH_3D1]
MSPPRSSEGYLYDASGPSCRGLPTEAVVQGSLHTRSSYDVVVIGAGFAGLVAARDVALDRNLRVLLLEARDRIGGRTWVAKAWGEDFEMGGTYVHWCQPHVFGELHRHGLEKDLKTSAGTTATEYINYKPKEKKDTQRVPDVAKYNAMLVDVAERFFSIDDMTPRQVMPYPHEPSRNQPWQRYDHMSAQDRLDQLDIPQDEKDMFSAHVSSFGSGPASETAWVDTLRWYALGGYGFPTMYDAAASFKIGNGGTTNLCRHILSEYNGDVVMNKQVTSLTQADGSGALIKCVDGSNFTARRVICTIPLNCLGDIKFDPPLSIAKQEAVKRGHMNIGEKYHFSMDEVQGNWFANTSPHGGADFVFGLKDHDGTQSSIKQGTYAMCFGKNGKLADPTNYELVISEYKKLQPEGRVKGYLSHTWSKDPYAKGAWFCASPNMTKHLAVLQRPHGRILMANADWANGWRGFIDGAIEQGHRAAAMVKASLASEQTAKIAML